MRPRRLATRLKAAATANPFVGRVAQNLYRLMGGLAFGSSKSYWQRRYRHGGTSGAGSYGRLAEFKARTLNTFVSDHGIKSVIEFGVGDGNQLRLARYPEYLGIDVSKSAISHCRRTFMTDETKSFLLLEDYAGQRADLTLSLDVVFHLVEDEVFEDHMRLLFRAARRFVIIYSSNTDSNLAGSAAHVRHRAFTRWIRDHAPSWRLVQRIPNEFPLRSDPDSESFSDFYIFGREYRESD